MKKVYILALLSLAALITLSGCSATQNAFRNLANESPSVTTNEPTPTPMPTPNPTPNPTPTPAPIPTPLPEERDLTYNDVTVEYEEYTRNPTFHDRDLVKIEGIALNPHEDDSGEYPGYVVYDILVITNIDVYPLEIWQVFYALPESYPRILPEDYITVYGPYAKLITFDTKSFGTVTYPVIVAEDIVIN